MQRMHTARKEERRRQEGEDSVKDPSGKEVFTTERERMKKGNAHTGRRGGFNLSDIFICVLVKLFMHVYVGLEQQRHFV